MRKPNWLAMAVFAFVAIAAEAQTYPVKPVHFVVNKPGAVGNIGTAHVAKGTPDGYTLLVTASVIGVINVATTPLVIVAGARFSATTLREAMDKAKAGGLTYASPGVPTVAESGFPDFEHYTWIGVFAPAATPANLVWRLNADIDKLLSHPDFRGRLTALGYEPVGGSPQSFARYVKSEIVRWADVVRKTGAKPE